MAAQSHSHPAPPPIVPPALPAAVPQLPATESDARFSDTAMTSSQGGLPVRSLSEDAQDQPFAITLPMARMPVALQVTVPVRDFRVKHLLAMEPGEVIESQWASGEDLPLASAEVQLAWAEFEVVDSRLAVRITRLA